MNYKIMFFISVPSAIVDTQCQRKDRGVACQSEGFSLTGVVGFILNVKTYLYSYK